MKKTLLAAALVAGFAGVAHAESSVTLYGVADAGYGFTSTKYTAGGTSYKINSHGARQSVQNGNRWGLKGTEDLGNGTSAIFVLEGGYTIADGRQAQDGRLFGRQAFVGLTGESWGTFTIGRQYTAADDYMPSFDPFGTGFRDASANSTFGSAIGYRQDAAVKYVSPNFDGFSFAVSLAANGSNTRLSPTEATTTRSGATNLSLGVGYDNGPFSVAASYTRNKNRAAGSVAAQAWNLGVAYDLDVVKLYAMFGQQRNGFIEGDAGAFNPSLPGVRVALAGRDVANIVNQNVNGLRSSAWVVGLSAPVGEAGKVMFSYQGARNKSPELVGHLRVTKNVYSLGYRHGLSKRTSVYALASHGTGKGKLSDTGATSKVKSTDFAVGLTHRF